MKIDAGVSAIGKPGVRNLGHTRVPLAMPVRMFRYLLPLCVCAASLMKALCNPVSGTLIGWADDTNYLTGMPVGLNNVVAISAAASQNYYSQNLALNSSGTVIAWGRNGTGMIETNVPAGLGNVVAIAAGADHYLALERGGRLISWEGIATYTAPAAVSNVLAIAAGDGDSLALRNDGTVIEWSNGGVVSFPAGSGTNFIGIAAENETYLALKNDGTVVAWGLNNVGQANVPAGLTNVAALTTDYTHSMALRNDGTVVSWGVNWDGQTNVPAGLSNVVAVAAGGIKGSHSLALKSDGTVVSWGAGLTNAPAGLSNVVAIAAGDYYGLAITANLQITAINPTNQGPCICFRSFAGQQYSVEYSHALALGQWLPLACGNVQGNGREIAVTDTNATDTVRFYRVKLVH